MDIRGRSNYPFRAPLTGPRIIPPSGRPCVGLTRLSSSSSSSSDRVAERRSTGRVERKGEESGGGARGYGVRIRQSGGGGEQEEGPREKQEVESGPSERARRDRTRGSRREAEATGRGRRACGENGGWKSEAAVAAAAAAAAAVAAREGGSGVGKTRSRGLLQSLRGQRESAAPAARSLAYSHGPLLLFLPVSLPPSLRTHACTQTRTARGVQFRARARSHVCTQAALQKPRVQSAEEARETPIRRIASLSPLLHIHASFSSLPSFLSSFRPPSLFHVHALLPPFF